MGNHFSSTPDGGTFADISWRDGEPYSEQFSDVYFSKYQGADEANYIFIQQNKLSERFQSMTEHFVIGETGFGTGLNFLCAWQCFTENAPGNAQLHFISFEKYPLAPSDLTRILHSRIQQFPEAEQLLQKIPACTSGQHRLIFDRGRISLTLVLGDIRETLPAALTADLKVDAWFFDGFAPAVNPQMWDRKLFQHMANASARQATYATFTAARMAKDALLASGFSVEKRPGFARKRHMLAGCLNKSAKSGSSDTPAWLRQATSPSKPQPKQACIVGAGMAGCHTARKLAENGWQVTLFERHDHICQEGSGNPQGMLYPKLSPSDTLLRQLIIQGFWYTRSRLLQIPPDRNSYDLCGLIQLAFSEQEYQKQLKLIDSLQPDPAFMKLMTAADLSELAGIRVEHSGLWFPASGWATPASWCAQLIDHPGIQLKTRCAVEQLLYTDSGWNIMTRAQPENSQAVSRFSVVVIACAHSTTNLQQTQHLPLKQIRGQITQLAASEKSSQLKTVLCGEGYIAPAMNNLHTAGATFTFNDTFTGCRSTEHHSNIEQVNRMSRALYEALDIPGLSKKQFSGRASYRCTTPDYFPVIGQAPIADEFRQQFSVLQKNARHRFNEDCFPPVYPGLYINTAHGSRGLMSAPLGAELIACMVNNESLPVSEPIRQAIHPARFLARSLKRKTTSPSVSSHVSETTLQAG